MATAKKAVTNRAKLDALMVIASVILFAYSAAVWDFDKTPAPIPTPTPTPTASATPSASPTPTQSATPAAPIKLVLQSEFTSTGTLISWKVPANTVALELKISASELGEAHLITLPKGAQSYAAEKNDTIGQTTFTLVATLKDGSQVTSRVLTLDGQY